MNKKFFLKLFGGAAVLAVIMFFVYQWLGGLNEVKMQTIKPGAYKVAGTEFKGKYNSDTLKKIVDEVKKFAGEHPKQTVFCIIDYHHPKAEDGMVEHFVGVLVKDSSFRIPKKFNIRHIMAGQAVRGIIMGHPLVMPKPYDVRRKLESFAESKNLKLRPYTIEIYQASDRIEVEVPVKGG